MFILFHWKPCIWSNFGLVFKTFRNGKTPKRPCWNPGKTSIKKKTFVQPKWPKLQPGTRTEVIVFMHVCMLVCAIVFSAVWNQNCSCSYFSPENHAFGTNLGYSKPFKTGKLPNIPSEIQVFFFFGYHFCLGPLRLRGLYIFIFLIQSMVVFTTSLPWRAPSCLCRIRRIWLHFIAKKYVILKSPNWLKIK